MLILSRKTGEKICIGENISIEVRRVAGNRVTLAIDAPKEIRILRGELQAAVEAFADPAELDSVAVDVPQDYAVSHQRIPASESLGYSI